MMCLTTTNFIIFHYVTLCDYLYCILYLRIILYSNHLTLSWCAISYNVNHLNHLFIVSSWFIMSHVVSFAAAAAVCMWPLVFVRDLHLRTSSSTLTLHLKLWDTFSTCRKSVQRQRRKNQMCQKKAQTGSRRICQLQQSVPQLALQDWRQSHTNSFFVFLHCQSKSCLPIHMWSEPCLVYWDFLSDEHPVWSKLRWNFLAIADPTWNYVFPMVCGADRSGQRSLSKKCLDFLTFFYALVFVNLWMEKILLCLKYFFIYVTNGSHILSFFDQLLYWPLMIHGSLLWRIVSFRLLGLRPTIARVANL